jgi:hypothetical protein
MPASFVSRIDRVAPERVLLTLRAEARVRVQGSALGWVRCGRERRWVWGAFDETFRIRSGSVSIRVVGLGGVCQRRLPSSVLYDLRPPRPRELRRRLRIQPPSAPRLRPLSITQPEEPPR